MAYNLPELRDSPFSQLMATLPSLLMRMKENQTAQSNKDREFLQNQKQQARQQFESDRAFRDANEDEIRTEKIQADKDFMSDYTAANKNPHLQYTYLMSRKDDLPYGMNFPTEERRLIKARANYDKMIELNQESIEADIRASDAIADMRTKVDMFKGMSATDKSNYDFYMMMSEQGMNPEDKQKYHRIAIGFLPKGKQKPTTYTGTKLDFMISSIKSENKRLIGKNYDENATIWFDSMKEIDPSINAEDMDIILDKIEEQNPFTPKLRRINPLQPPGIGELLKQKWGAPLDWSKFNIESLRK